MKFCLLTLTLFFSLSISANEFTYFVSPNNPKSSDLSRGKLNSPLKTLKEALRRAQSGDIIKLDNATFQGPFQTIKSGKNDSPITIVGSGKTVLSNAQKIKVKWNKLKNNTWTTKNIITKTKYLFLGENVLKKTISKGLEKNQFLYNRKNKTLTIKLNNKINPNEHFLEVPKNGAVLSLLHSHYIIKDLIIEKSGIDSPGVKINSSFIQFVDITSRYNDGHGIKIGSKRNEPNFIDINNSRIYFNIKEGIKSFAQNISIRNSEVYKNGQRSHQNSIGINLLGKKSRPILSSNTVYDHKNIGVYYETLPKEKNIAKIIIRDSKIYDNKTGIVIKNCLHCDFFNNQFNNLTTDMRLFNTKRSKLSSNTFHSINSISFYKSPGNNLIECNLFNLENHQFPIKYVRSKENKKFRLRNLFYQKRSRFLASSNIEDFKIKLGRNSKISNRPLRLHCQ